MRARVRVGITQVKSTKINEMLSMAAFQPPSATSAPPIKRRRSKNVTWIPGSSIPKRRVTGKDQRVIFRVLFFGDWGVEGGCLRKRAGLKQRGINNGACP